MSYTVTQNHILSVAADAAVISVENPMVISSGVSNEERPAYTLGYLTPKQYREQFASKH